MSKQYSIIVTRHCDCGKWRCLTDCVCGVIGPFDTEAAAWDYYRQDDFYIKSGLREVGEDRNEADNWFHIQVSEIGKPDIPANKIPNLIDFDDRINTSV